MKILHLNTIDKGGAAVSVLWLNKRLNQLGIQSKIFVQARSVNEKTIISSSINPLFYKKFLWKVDFLPFFLYPNRKKVHWSNNLIINRSVHTINSQKADLIHLHWIGNGFIPISGIPKIKKPIIWTIRDMWPFTGGCHYSNNCKKFNSICEKCPALGSKNSFDLSKINFLFKLKYWREIEFNLVALSDWIVNCLQKSAIFKVSNIVKIPNGLDIELFKPSINQNLRKRYNISDTANLILFGAVQVEDKRKGFHHFLRVIEYLKDKIEDLEIFIFGRSISKKELFSRDKKIHHLGFINDFSRLIEIYSISDVYVFPSEQDAFGKTVIEAMACETPVVAFDFSGPKEIIDHKVNGFLAKPFDSYELAEGVKWIITNNSDHKISSAARKKVVENYNMKLVTQKYVELYEEVLSR